MQSGTLPDETVDWLKSNFFKTELELGHCLRLPAEGPCECDIYLSCAKFVTTRKYAPRLRTRLACEHQLVRDADERGWAREVERHTAIAHRIQDLLTDLGENTKPDELDATSIKANLDNTGPPTTEGEHAEGGADVPQLDS